MKVVPSIGAVYALYDLFSKQMGVGGLRSYELKVRCMLAHAGAVLYFSCAHHKTLG